MAEALDLAFVRVNFDAQLSCVGLQDSDCVQLVAEKCISKDNKSLDGIGMMVAVKCVNAITLDHETTFPTFRNQESSVFAFLWYIFSSTAHSRNNYGTLSMICRFGFPRTYCLSFPLTNKHLAQLDYRISE